MSTQFINDFFKSISNYNYSEELLSYLSEFSPFWDDEECRNVYHDFLNQFDQNISDEDARYVLYKWQFYIENHSDRVVKTVFDYEASDIMFVKKPTEDLVKLFFEEYVLLNSLRFVEIFKPYDEYLLVTYSKVEYLEKIEDFKFHFNKLALYAQSEFQIKIVQNIREELLKFGVSFNITSENTEYLPKEESQDTEALGLENSLLLKEEGECPLKDLEYYKNQVKEWKFLKLKDFIRILESLVLNENKNGVKFMEEQCLINSIERIYFEDKTRPKGIIRLGKGQINFVVNKFYQLYNFATVEGIANIAQPYKDIILENFEFQPNVIDKNRIDQNFRKIRGKK